MHGTTEKLNDYSKLRFDDQNYNFQFFFSHNFLLPEKKRKKKTITAQ